MKSTCVRCGRAALAVLNVEATIGDTRLTVSGEAREAAICAACVIELAKWFKAKAIGHAIGGASDLASDANEAKPASKRG
jgi:hypothetical protein